MPDPHTSDSRPQTRLTPAQTVTGAVATLVILVVVVVTFFVVSPPGTPLRSEVRSAALPYFGQNWRVFAPNVLKLDRTLEFRAAWYDESGERIYSDWVDVTSIEQRTVKGNPMPSLIRKSTWNASATYLTRYLDLDDEQRTRARDTFIQRTDDGFGPIPDAQLIEELGADDGDVIAYLRMDYMLMRNLTFYATAGFGEEIERVQWRIVRDRPNDFTHRFDSERQFEPAVTTFGWRYSNVVVEPELVADYRGLLDRTGAQRRFEEAAENAQ